MKRQDMEQMKALTQELDTLIKKYRETPAEYVGDTYGDYRSGFKQIKVMHGYSTEKKDRLRKKIRKKEDEIRRKLEEMEDWLESIEDAEMRDILRLYYAVGHTQEEIADMKGFERSSISKKLEKFWRDQNC